MGKKVGEKKEKESFYYIYTYYYISIYIFFTSKPVTRTTKQVLPKLVPYLNNLVLLLMALPYNRSPEEMEMLMFTTYISPRT